jgi:dTDP-4-dehydrorhamnose reductase
MMRILVLGRTGQVALSLQEVATASPGVELLALGRPQIDFEDSSTMGDVISAARPDLVVNAAAYTAVDKAEQDADRAFAINCHGAGAAAAATARLGVPFIHLSTDYVYSGDKDSPYLEDDPTGPLGVYGRSKLAGELRVRDEHPSPLILRTSWVYSPFGANFVKTMLRLATDRPVLSVVDDQTGSPTSALGIASAILRIAPDLSVGGTYHLCGGGETTWCGFARHIFTTSQMLGGPSAEVRAITTQDYPTAATRPANSRMSMDAFSTRFGFRPDAWQMELETVLEKLLARDQAQQHVDARQAHAAANMTALEKDT